MATPAGTHKMGYRAFHKETTRYLALHARVKTHHEVFASPGRARAAITREARRGAITAADFAVLSCQEFARIEKTTTVKNLMTGQPIKQSVNTPRACDPSSELYWCC